MSSPFYITTAIPYANGAPHIGHAYERIATDAIQRFMRLDGRETLFVTGMDEHGLKMQQTAAREGLTPQALADRTAVQFEAMGALLNAPADDIVRTTQARHKRAVQAIWERMAAAGDIYLSNYRGWYSVRDEAYFDESERRAARGGGTRAPRGAPAQWVEEESYFFKLSAYGDRLLALYEANPDFAAARRASTRSARQGSRLSRDEDTTRAGHRDADTTETGLTRAGPGHEVACHFLAARHGRVTAATATATGRPVARRPVRRPGGPRSSRMPKINWNLRASISEALGR